MTADCRQFIDQVDPETGIRQVKRRLDTTDPSSDNHHIGKFTLAEAFPEIPDIFIEYCLFFHIIPYMTSLIISVMSFIIIDSPFSTDNLLSSKFVMQ